MGSGHQYVGHTGLILNSKCSQGEELLASEKELEGWSQGTGFESQLEGTSLETLERVPHLAHSVSSSTKLSTSTL